MIGRVFRNESIATLTVGSQISDAPFFNVTDCLKQTPGGFGCQWPSAAQFTLYLYCNGLVHIICIRIRCLE